MTKKLYFNGNVITVNNKEEVVQAVAIEDGKIIKVGTNEEILSLKDNDTEVIDLEGKTMLPGFIDPHGHIVPVAQTLMIVTLGDVTSKEELLARLEESLKNILIKCTTSNGKNDSFERNHCFKCCPISRSFN